ncbi:MAG: cache domain-containing protein [Alphaproteobacteria bacterium]|nr:cache domain-containing protein [Alphaproteobacteria bacterium]
MRTIVTGLAFLLCIAAATAAPARGSAAEARAMLQRAVAALRTDPVAAITAFNKTDGGFRDRDLYVACFDARSGKVVAHVDAKQLGVDVRSLKQPDGAAFGKKLFDAAKAGRIATVDYEYYAPGGSSHVPKRSFITRVGSNACLVGYYLPANANQAAPGKRKP